MMIGESLPKPPKRTTEIIDENILEVKNLSQKKLMVKKLFRI